MNIVHCLDQNLLLDKADPSPEQEEASLLKVETLDSDAVLAPSPYAELNKTLNIARASTPSEETPAIQV